MKAHKSYKIPKGVFQKKKKKSNQMNEQKNLFTSDDAAVV